MDGELGGVGTRDQIGRAEIVEELLAGEPDGDGALPRLPVMAMCAACPPNATVPSLRKSHATSPSVLRSHSLLLGSSHGHRRIRYHPNDEAVDPSQGGVLADGPERADRLYASGNTEAIASISSGTCGRETGLRV